MTFLIDRKTDIYAVTETALSLSNFTMIYWCINLDYNNFNHNTMAAINEERNNKYQIVLCTPYFFNSIFNSSHINKHTIAIFVIQTLVNSMTTQNICECVYVWGTSRQPNRQRKRE